MAAVGPIATGISLRLSASPVLNIALRAKKLDQVALKLTARHPDAVVLDLGVGLDTRMFRIRTPSTVDWYDVDSPEVITARRQLLPDRANAHGIGTDLTDPNWLDAISTNRPAVIVADGLLAFLTPGRHDLPAEPSHWPLSQWRGGLQRLHQVRHLGGETLPRHPIRRGPHQISRLRRPPRARTLELQTEARPHSARMLPAVNLQAQVLADR